MKQTTVLLFLLCLPACGDSREAESGPAGPLGPTGPQGLPGSVGQSGPGLGVIWRDQTGKFVTRTAGPMDRLFVADANGVFWELTRWAEVIGQDLPEHVNVLYHVEPDCAGEPYVNAGPPNIAYNLPLNPGRYFAPPADYYTSPDWEHSKLVSHQTPDGCMAGAPPAPAVPVADVEVTPPSLDLDRPLYPEPAK